MSSAALELQGAIISLLKADATVASIVDVRVYDHVPRNSVSGEITAKFPFVGLGATDELTESVDCVDVVDLSIDIECWSRSPGFPEVRRLAHAVREALHETDIPLTDNAIVLFEHRQTRTLRDPDGLTSHAILTFEAALEQN